MMVLSMDIRRLLLTAGTPNTRINGELKNNRIIQLLNIYQGYNAGGRMFHKSQGYTLVEVIVVAVIVAVLAAVAIPLYIGYVNDAAQNMANNEATNFSTAVTSGINEGATAVTYANNVYTWTMPATFFGGTAPAYRAGRGATITVNVADMIIPGKTATITVRGKTATASW